MRHLAAVILATVTASTAFGTEPPPASPAASGAVAPGGGALDELWASPVAGGRHRASSWDQIGGNRDFLTIKPGERDYVFADVKDTEGRYVGTILAVESHPSRPGKWYEGDDRFLIDGRELLHGTGTEDYFGMAWGFHRLYQGYDHGVSHNERGLTKEDRFYDGQFVAYRWHLNDPIPFRRSLRASIEAGHGNECAQHYESVALWYGRPCEHEAD